MGLVEGAGALLLLGIGRLLKKNADWFPHKALGPLVNAAGAIGVSKVSEAITGQPSDPLAIFVTVEAGLNAAKAGTHMTQAVLDRLAGKGRTS